MSNLLTITIFLLFSFSISNIQPESNSFKEWIIIPSEYHTNIYQINFFLFPPLITIEKNLQQLYYHVCDKIFENKIHESYISLKKLLKNNPPLKNHQAFQILESYFAAKFGNIKLSLEILPENNYSFSSDTSSLSFFLFYNRAVLHLMQMADKSKNDDVNKDKEIFSIIPKLWEFANRLPTNDQVLFLLEQYQEILYQNYRFQYFDFGYHFLEYLEKFSFSNVTKHSPSYFSTLTEEILVNIFHVGKYSQDFQPKSFLRWLHFRIYLNHFASTEISKNWDFHFIPISNPHFESEVKFLISQDKTLEYLWRLTDFIYLPYSSSDIIQYRHDFLNNIEWMIEYLDKGGKVQHNYQEFTLSLINSGKFRLSYHDTSNKVIFQQTEKFFRSLLHLNSTNVYTFTGHFTPIFNTSGNLLRKIRVGFVSSLLYPYHSVFKLLYGIIANLPRNIFQIIISAPHPQEFTKILQPMDTLYILTSDLDTDVANIRKQECDIIIFGEIGMHTHDYLLALHKMAPIYTNFWGHSDTSGLTTMDYFITSQLYELDDDNTRLSSIYSETVTIFQHLTFYYLYLKQVRDFESLSREQMRKDLYKDIDLYVPEKAHRYCHLSSLFKNLPSFDFYIRDILELDKEGVIIMISSPNFKMEKSHFISRIEQKFTIDQLSRLIWIKDQLDIPDFIRVLHSCDVILDTYPFGGGNSVLEAFMVNRGVVIQPGKLINGRFALGFYKKMGIMDLVANNQQEYVNIAVRMATDIEYRNYIENQIAQKRHLLFKETNSIQEWTNLLYYISTTISPL